MSEVKQYGDRDLMALDEAGGYYIRHVDHMTSEKLHSKSDIAAELGWRDMQIASLKAERDALAAENAALKAAIAKYAKVKQDFDDFDGDRRGIAACVCEAEDALVDGIKTPATDAYANQLRAEGVEMFAAHLRTDKTETSVCKMIALGADEFAAILRACKDGD